MERKLIFGPPGTGKTEFLLRKVDECIKAGIPPNRIAFVSFTKASVREARERAMIKFGLSERDLPYFRTAHSLIFHALGLRRSDVFGREDESKLAELTGEDILGHTDIDVQTIGNRGDSLLFLDQTSRAKMIPLRDEYERHGGDFDWWRLERFVEAYKLYRADHGKLDFTDMLEMFVGKHNPLLDRGYTGRPLPLDIAIIDEVQDFTALMWCAMELAFKNAKELICAGDDDQCLYSWAGSDVDAMLNFDGSREVLHQSYRLPREIHKVASEVVSRIHRRQPKVFAPRDTPGTVDWVVRPEEVDLSTGTWLLLARTRRQLGDLVALARGQGVAYSVMGVSAVPMATVRLIQSWETLRRGGVIMGEDARKLVPAAGLTPGVELESGVEYTAPMLGAFGVLPIWHEALRSINVDEREYMISCLRRNEKLTKEPRVKIGTFHYAKGQEADNVMMLTDITERVRRSMELDEDSENRVLYVGLTRAKENLFLVSPRNSRAYQI